ncbi:ribosomal RNA small subunit methyltransferase [Paenibacillus sp. 32O-W]|uniref:16S rRNA (cytosine(967)-C(5))-methyltransferase RsmB n=1 Tax=Paenibacillus sp. 32O-W TaxID=1695218 RepID=UPI00071FD158|nr:16S rRNA (cytosine(967)-C(5))-methyltransferase RsmB [Paenibacillus sp. 32O-W]ALS27471.1 ribosomal RNA small subunit methyltransferase [Paenibacillus sp. 32O-W]
MTAPGGGRDGKHGRSGQPRPAERRTRPSVSPDRPGGHVSGRSGGSAAEAGADDRRQRAARKADGRPHPERGRSARTVALDALLRVAEAGAYSNLELNRALRSSGLSRVDAALATELVYGTIQRRHTLDALLARFVAKGLERLQPWVLELLRMSAYQLVFLDRVPPHAAVNEAVAIAKKRGHAGIAGMVNGVLRSLQRSIAQTASGEGGAAEQTGSAVERTGIAAEQIGSADERTGSAAGQTGGAGGRPEAPIVLAAAAGLADPAERIALRHSYPAWLVRRWIAVFGEAGTEAICAAGNEPPHASVRVNRLRLSPEEALARLTEAGFDARPSDAAAAGIVVRRGGNLADSDGYRAGLWTVQDESSMLVAEVAAPRPGMRALDCCAAPGGKTTHLAELMEDRGEVWANDLHPHKRKLIEDQAGRLGLASVRAITGDAAELDRRFDPASFDVVLLDAPCTGFGVIRRKPDIKWTKSPEDIAAIADLQRRLLETAAALVRPGGTLVYSTCTIEPEENENQIARFLERHPEFAADPAWPERTLAALRRAGAIGGGPFPGMAQILPHHFGSDGFFIARLRRRSDS